MGQNTSVLAEKDPENNPNDDIKLHPVTANDDETEQNDVHKELRQAAAEQNYNKVKSLLRMQNRADPTKCDENGRNALHHACRYDLEEETDIIEDLLKSLLDYSGCNEKINDTDNKNHTALWYAIKYRNSKAAITLVDKGADFTSRAKDKDREGNTAFHEACLAGLFDVIETMLSKASSSNTSSSNPVHWKGHLNATPLHAACKNNQLKIVKKLIEKGADVRAEDDTGKTPLHAAASGVKSEGTIETVDYLLKHGAMKILNKQSLEEENKTPLSTACYYGHHEAVKFLLDKGAKVDKNCLKYAVERDFSYTARVLVQCSQWKQCLRQILPNGEPIMNEIIRKMPEVAIDVLDKCTTRRKQRLDEKGCVAFNFEFLECFKETGSAFEDKNKQSRASHYIELEDPAQLAKHHAKKDIEQKEKEFEDVIRQCKQSFGPQWGPKQFKKSQHPLSVIVKSGNYQLLTHPVVRSLLYYKWMRYGFGYYVVNLVIFLAFLTFATSYSLTVASPFSQDCPAQGNGTCNIPESKQMGIQFAAIMTILFVIFHLVIRVGKEVILMIKLHKKYFTSVRVLFDWADIPSYVLVIVFAFIFPYDCPCPPAWQWEIGIIGLFLSWITLLKFANKFPIISKYVLMFGRIIETFVKVALTIGIPLVLAFAWPFYMALHDPEVTRSPFQDFGIAIAKVLSMTTGNFDYDSMFRRDSSGESDLEDELPFLPVTYILWIVFIILMPVLLNNLLVGLAIGDIKSVEEQAELRKLVLKVELVLEIEELFLPYIRTKLRTGYRIVYPWKPRTIKWLKQIYEYPEMLQQVFDRKEHQTEKHTSGRHHYTPAEHHHHHTTTEHIVRRATAHKGKYDLFGSDQGQHFDLQARLERVEDLLERMAEKMHVPI